MQIKLTNLIYLNTYNLNQMQAFRGNQRIFIDSQLNVKCSELYSWFKYFRAAISTTDHRQTAGQDFHTVLLNQKSIICVDGALYQVGNNFHKLIDIPDLVPEDCNQNLAVCGSNLAVRDSQQRVFVLPLAVLYEKIPRFHSIFEISDVTHIATFADRCFVLKNNSVWRLKEDLILEELAHYEDYNSVLDQGGLIVIGQEDGYIVVNCCDGISVELGEVGELEFFNFADHSELTIYGMSYTKKVINDNLIDLFPDFYRQRASIWFRHIFKNGSEAMKQSYINYKGYDEVEKAVLEQVMNESK